MATSKNPKSPAKRSTDKANQSAQQLELELVRFKTGDKNIEFSIDITGETVWATQQQIADLFERDRTDIVKHIKNIFSEGELDEEAVCAKIAQTGPDGKTYGVIHYNLDLILSVGYRVSGPKATRFRKWATQTLRSYIVDGFALNESRLRDDPANLNKLAATLRALRSDEKNLYASVREFFKLASTDYDSKARSCRSFYALLQDKFHYAITGQTASQIILGRADHSKPNMGVQHFGGNLPTIEEATIGKNYLGRDELYTLHILCEQFLLYVESKAIRGKSMTMEELAKKLDELLNVNEYPVFRGWKDFLHDKAIKHAQVEYARFLMRLKSDDVKQIPKG